MTKEECIALLNRYAEYNGMGIPNLAGCREAMRTAAELLQRPSLPSNLDEAAEEYGLKEAHGENNYVAAYHRYGFKAGAEWMAGQGETIEGEVMKDINNNLCVTAKGFSGKEAKFGDKVVVQIRKN